MPLASGDEEIFKSVISAQPIKNSPLTDLENVLKLVMLKIGIRAENLPSPEEKFILIDHILTSYGNHTIAEIRLAFDMALSSKLGLPAKEVVCYENFSCLYFSKIMNAYRIWATETYQYVSSRTPIALIEDKKELSNEEWEEWIADMKKYDVNILPCAAYDYLIKIGRLTITTSQKHEYMERSISVLQETFELGTKEQYAFLKMKKEGVYSTEITSSLITISKRLAIYDYLQSV